MLYARYIKRIIDFVLTTIALFLFSPLIIFLTIAGILAVRGNPFFIQKRPGLNEKIFKLIKFRTMTNEKDKNGEYLPDELRLTPYGRFLRRTSLDELPELINIWKGDMAIVGPRPLLVRYLPFYTERERKRHLVRPGLTGLAQISGRNSLAWNSRLDLDVNYVENMSFLGDVRIILKTVGKVIRHENVVDAGSFEMLDLDQERNLNSGNNKN